MKKYLALLLAAIMALSLAACASTAKTEDAASTSGKLTMATEATFQPYEDYDGDAIAIAKENTDLLEKVNKALSELTADGTLQSIVDKYIK